MKQKIIAYTSLTLNKKTALVFILVFITVAIFDTTIVSFSSYSGVEFPTWLNLTIFVIFSIIFATGSTILLNSVRKIVSKYSYKPAPRGLAYFQGIIIATVFLTGVIIPIIIFQMLLLSHYSLVLLQVQTYLSHLSALGFLAFLVFMFGSWLASKRDYKILLYAISFSLISIDIMVTLVYLETYFSIFNSVLPEVTPFPLSSYVINLPGSPSTELLSIAFDVLTLSSFLIMWITTSVSLSQYRYKLGKIKYFSLMSIPLIYYIFPFQNYFGDAFFSSLQSSPVFYSIIYILSFSATKQAGALLFSLSFWTAAALVYDNRVRQSLLVSSIGMAILFSSLEITPLQYRVFPPYGLITEAFIPLGSYLLFVGIFTSAKHISRDSEVRKELYKNAASQLTLLKAIGVSQMEKELEAQAESIEKRFKPFERTDEPDLKAEEIKEILHDVLTELYYSKGKKTIGVTDE
ncbi:MAG: hypothetical protein WCC17_06800 [Candidatus Nitrosopolaris sp.]